MNSAILFIALLLWQQGQAKLPPTLTGDITGTAGTTGLQLADMSDWPPKKGDCFQVTATQTLEKIPCPVYPASATVTIDPKKAVCPLAVDCSIVRGETTLPPRGLPAPAPPFDVPPVETVTYDPPMPKNWEKLIGTGRSCVVPLSANENRGQLCLDGVVHDIYYTRTCKDESRYLLERSDGTWHCLALSQVPR